MARVGDQLLAIHVVVANWMNVLERTIGECMYVVFVNMSYVTPTIGCFCLRNIALLLWLEAQ